MAEERGGEAVTTDQDTGHAPPAGAARGRPGRRAGIAAVVGVIGELLITAGLVLALFVVYSLWWTNVIANRQAERESDRVRDGWERRGSAPAREYRPRDGIGFLHVPALGDGFEALIVKGTEPEELNKGVAGYYTEPRRSALPWDRRGNFALAAHRDGHGAKFHDLDRLGKGEFVVVETKDRWYVYKVFATLPQTSKFNVGVIDPVPKGSGKRDPGRYITLTTCTPVYTSRYRMVVWGELVRTEKVDARRTLPAELRQERSEPS